MLRKTIITSIVIFVWTLLCIYGTYDNTVKNAQIKCVDGGYEVTYMNTHEIHFYQEGEN